MPTIHVITNEHGKIVAAMYGSVSGTATLFPLPGQRMHQIEDVPAEVAGIANPLEFHKAISKHFNTKGAKVTLMPLERHPQKAAHAQTPG